MSYVLSYNYNICIANSNRWRLAIPTNDFNNCNNQIVDMEKIVISQQQTKSRKSVSKYVLTHLVLFRLS